MSSVEEKTYSVGYIYGVLIPTEEFIEISTIAPLTEDFIKDEIVRKRNLSPLGKNQIVAITSTTLLRTNKLDNGPITF